MPSNEVLYLLAYIKYRGGIQNITPSDLIVDEYMIGTQKGTVWPNVSQSDTPISSTPSPLQMQMKGKSIEIRGLGVWKAVKAVYNIDDLVSEYYSTPAQKSQINSILQEGERHNLLDVLALLKAMQVKPAEYYEQGTIEYASPEGSNSLAIGADVSALVVINGEDVTICISGAAAAGYPVHYSYSHYKASELLSEYYSTIAQQTAINKNIDAAIKGYME